MNSIAEALSLTAQCVKNQDHLEPVNKKLKVFSCLLGHRTNLRSDLCGARSIPVTTLFYSNCDYLDICQVPVIL